MIKFTSIRVDEKILKKVRKSVAKSRHTISGFYDIAATEKLDRDSLSKTIKASDNNNVQNNFK